MTDPQQQNTPSLAARQNAVTITFGGPPSTFIKAGLGLSLLLGTALIVTAVYGFATGDGQGFPPTPKQTGAAIVTLLIGLFLGAPGYITVIFWKAMTGKRHLTFDRTGVRFQPPTRPGFAVRWEELSAARIRVTQPLRVSNVEHPVYFKADRTGASLELQALNPEHFAQVHPEMKRFWSWKGEPGLYFLPFNGDVSQQLPHMADAIFTYAPQTYGGVVSGKRGPLS
ncbi:hypothetical protein [Salinifilum ghardaiensis]